MKWVVLYSLAAVPALLPLWLIYQYSVDFPFWDQMMPSLAGALVKLQQHTLTLSDLVSQHNEHRILIPRLIYLPLAWLTHWSIRAELITEFLVVCLTAAGIARLILITCQADPKPQPSARIGVLLFLSNAVIFNIVQFENWLWGLGLANVLPMFFITVALVLITSGLSRWKRAAAVMLCSVAATYSSGSGLLCWPIATAMFAFSSTREELRLKRAPLLTILCAFVLTIGLYFIGYSRPADHAAVGFHPLRHLAYFVAFLGNTFAFSTTLDPSLVGAIIGTCMLLMLVSIGAFWARLWLVERDHRTTYRMLIWLLIASFPILGAAMASIARGNLGPTQALTSRYVSFSLYLPLALIHLVWIVTEWMNRRGANMNTDKPPRLSSQIAAQAPAVLTTLILMLLLQRLSGALQDAGVYRRNQTTFQTAVIFCRALPDTPLLNSVEGLPAEVLIRNAIALDELGNLRPRLLPSNDLSPLVAAVPNPAAKGAALRVWSPSQGVLATSGWAILDGQEMGNFAVFITCDDASGRPLLLCQASTGLQTPDQPAALSPETPAGWLASFPMSRLPGNLPGYRLSAWLYSPDSNRATRLAGDLRINL